MCVYSEKQTLRWFFLTFVIVTVPSSMIVSQDSEPTCNIAVLQRLQSSVSDVNEALSTLASCIAYFDATSFEHIKSDNSDYCLDSPSSDPALRLANIELRLAAFEGTQQTFCCSQAECAANCPNANNLMGITCDADCKTPHKPGLLTTLDPTTRIQNVANRVLALKPLIETGVCEVAKPTPAKGTGKGTQPQKTGGTSTPSQTTQPTSGSQDGTGDGNLP
jgi:hypothetical protein